MRLYFMVLASLLIFFHAFHVWGQEEQNVQGVGVLPFSVNKDGKYGYLGTSIRQMLVARLSQQDKLRIVPVDLSVEELRSTRQLLQSGDFRRAVKEAEADWLIDGTMYSLKDGLQVNLTMYPASAEKGPVSYGIKAEHPDEIIPVIAELAEEVQESLAGDSKYSSEEEEEKAEKGVSGFQTPHPERAYKKGLYSGGRLFSGSDDRFQSRGVRRSSTIPLTVETMALGDLDGDGENEIVAASRSKIRVFHFRERRFQVAAEYDFSPRIKIHVVNIADPGASGRMKLFVSANEGRYPASAIMTWDGSDELTMVREKIRWYLRPLSWPGRGVILAGQRDSPNLSDNFLAPGVFQLTWPIGEGDIERVDKLLLPEKTNLFDFILADFNGDGAAETAVINEQEKLMVYDSALNLVWVSGANYGGSKKFFGPPLSARDDLDPTGINSKQQDLRKLVYIPGRMDVKDITGDGLPELVVGTNDVGLSEYVTNVRAYEGGAVACLSWRGSGLMELWRTNHITGYVADYVFDGDGQESESRDGEAVVMNRLFVAQIPDASYLDLVLPGSNDSKILAYEMVVKKEDKASNTK